MSEPTPTPSRGARRSPFLGVVALGLLVVLMVSTVVVADRGLRGWRLDLTEQRLFTLTSGTRSILRSIDEPITLTLYYSESIAADRGSLKSHAERVLEVLDEYRAMSRGNITIELVDPMPDSEAEDRATAAGIAALPLSVDERFYLGLAGVNSTDGRETIPLLDPREERFLEYELTRLVYNLANPERPTLGLISSLPVDGSPPMPGVSPGSAPWQSIERVRSLFDIENLGTEFDAVPDSIDALLIIHPKNLSEQTTQAIDAFARTGKGVVVFVDPLAEADVPPAADQFQLAQADRSSSLTPLFEAWGVVFDPAQVAADADAALPVDEGGRPVPFLPYLRLGAEHVNADDPSMQNLTQVILAAAGSVSQAEGATTSFEPLLTTGERAGELEAQSVAFFPVPRELLARFEPGETSLILAARVSGPVSGPVSEAEGESENINVVVVADVDLLTDRFWVQPVRLGDAVIGYQSFADNADLLVNLLDNLAGSSDLISVRARGTFQRPFTVVERMQRDADLEFAAEQERLQNEIDETQRRINELQAALPDDGSFLLSPEQAAQIDRLEDELRDGRANLRRIAFERRADIERLGLRVTVINTLAAPAVVVVLGLLVALWRRARRGFERRRADREQRQRAKGDAA